MTRTQIKQYQSSLIKIESLPGEIWVECKGYEGLYFISNKERLKKVGYWTDNGKGHKRYKKEKLISINKKRKYPSIGMYKNGVKEYKLFHRLVCDSFHPNKENKPEVNHIKGWRHGHTPENLEWVTRRDNVLHAYRNGFINPAKGENHPCCKVSDSKIKEIKEKYKTGLYTTRGLGREYGVSCSLISNIINNKRTLCQ